MYHRIWTTLMLTCIFWNFCHVTSLREFRSWSDRAKCAKAKHPNYPFAYEKYKGQLYESKGRVNVNEQDFRHECVARGGRSKCNICENIECKSADPAGCALQLQGVDASEMSRNVAIVSDTAWTVGGDHRRDYGNNNVSHYCVFTSGKHCIEPNNVDYSDCPTRCFGYGLKVPVVPVQSMKPSLVDLYPGMRKWAEDGLIDNWQYPRNCSDLLNTADPKCTYSGRTPSFNTQGFVFTLAGQSVPGSQDGNGVHAKFNAPEDLTVDSEGTIFVADTMNNQVRMIDVYGNVTTLAGKGPNVQGYADGDCADATFSRPKGIDVRIAADGTKVVLISDTGNHRIRRLELTPSGSCNVRCFTGLCGLNTLSKTTYKEKSWPIAGFADGDGDFAKFSAPEGIAYIDDNYAVSADTGNFLIRLINDNGTTWTLAGGLKEGGVDPRGNPLAGAPPPGLVGHQGFQDGPLDEALFYSPVDVTRGPNNTVYVADEHRIRMIELPHLITTIQDVRSMGRVSTVAGNSLQGREDGSGAESSFFGPSGIYVTPEGVTYIADSISCRIRRITPANQVAQMIGCGDSSQHIVRPSGCTSYDQTLDKTGRKYSRFEKNIQYNYGAPYREEENWMESDLERGKYIKNCVGVPPPDKLDKKFLFKDSGINLVVDDEREAVNEDSEQGMAIMVMCPADCGVGIVRGNRWYSDDTPICRAAIHDGKLTADGGIVNVILQRKSFIANTTYSLGTTANGITSLEINANEQRVFRLETMHKWQSMVHSVAGLPSAPLESACGYRDGEPPNNAQFNLPLGIAGFGSPSDTKFLYITDTENNRIRALSATCTQICENGGRCTGDDQCTCPEGWTGVDCTKPVCTTPIPTRKVCVGGSEMFACRPGWTGPNCDIPQCIQTCVNGACTSPDTCTCSAGWFDTNCTTPVCSQTCANGGNCTGPNQCKCPTDWTGHDCRTPVCSQTCLNGGYCSAPNTCICAPQWINYDCSVPVCHQGFYRRNPSMEKPPYKYSGQLITWGTYRACNLEGWCSATKEFECLQPREMYYGVVEVKSGGEWRNITGRKNRPDRCMKIELPINFKVPYEVLRADNTTTGYARYTKITNYTSNALNPWRGYEVLTKGHTGPWSYTEDRQIATVDYMLLSQGHYVCANGGNCTAPDVCECAPGWMGFDCRTPVCNQGYYFPKQKRSVSGRETQSEIYDFNRFMQNNTRRQWPYANPKYTMQWETYVPAEFPEEHTTEIEVREHGNVSYLGQELWYANGFSYVAQGGYRCSIRAVTLWENYSTVFVQPNYYSRYMDYKVQADGKAYTHWSLMHWPPLHQKSPILDQTIFNRTYVYTNEGWRRNGVWSGTGSNWEYGTCIMEFYRRCPGGAHKQYDLEAKRANVYVQDVDVAYRPRVQYSDTQVTSVGRWDNFGGECVDEVVRGCYNNGTCIAPNTCECSIGWSGFDCTTPICTQTCQHNGNCTAPDTCTCQQGWEGFDCSIPLCSQECNNGGTCIAPDTCECSQFESEFRDYRVGGGQPLFKLQNGNPRKTGWTGFDCSVPICVQAQKFVLNSPTTSSNYGGRGADDLLQCTNAKGVENPRCPQFDTKVTTNDGRSFQTGCGWDPLDTGCCVVDTSDPNKDGQYKCYRCPDTRRDTLANSFYCKPLTAEDAATNGPYTNEWTGEVTAVGATYDVFSGAVSMVPSVFRLSNEIGWEQDDKGPLLKMCGPYHQPRKYVDDLRQLDYGIAKYFVPENRARVKLYASKNYNAETVSDRFLCGVKEWNQGDYIDDAGWRDVTGVGTFYGLLPGRHVRINNPNMIKCTGTTNCEPYYANMSAVDSAEFNDAGREWLRGPKEPGEGLFLCGSEGSWGSCLAPDLCSCVDGYTGFDCSQPMCRHLQPAGNVTACQNGGICKSRDTCHCIRTESQLWMDHPEMPKQETGWTGSDCSMPMCTQGIYDPFCTDLPQAPGGEGCYRCANGGNCTAPDKCTCAPGWTGYNCQTPICETIADPLTRKQLGTLYEDKIISFEQDPCGAQAIFFGPDSTPVARGGWKGRKYARGNCTLPNQCTCLCKQFFNVKACHKGDELSCEGPWQDPLVDIRNVLSGRGTEFTFGTQGCSEGFEGNVDGMDRFITCHLTIYVPSDFERSTITYLIAIIAIVFIVSIIYYFVRRRISRRYLLAKIERRRSKRSSEESLMQTSAFRGSKA